MLGMKYLFLMRDDLFRAKNNFTCFLFILLLFPLILF
jgi:hypothetical protein